MISALELKCSESREEERVRSYWSKQEGLMKKGGFRWPFEFR